MRRIVSYLPALVLAAASIAAMLFFFGPSDARAACVNGVLQPGAGEDLEVTTACTVPAGAYQYGNVNIYGGGRLEFQDAAIDFWAKSILVENQGSLVAGSEAAPIGANGGTLTIHLYGADQGQGGQGITCQSPGGLCGIPINIWNSNGASPVALPGGVTDYFYQYAPLMFDDGGATKGYFGYKVLAVSYGGTLHLFGKKGACYASNAAACGSDTEPANSGLSWRRLTGTLQPTGTTLVVDALVDWTTNDHIVVTTTDYLPGHSEELVISSPPTRDTVAKTTTITFTNANPAQTGVEWIHNGETFSLASLPSRLGIDSTRAETRAAVALLSRSIRVVSEGPSFNTPLPAATAACEGQDGVPCNRFFGGHTIVREGFESFHVQGVEFFQLGQGGRMMHYPVHFHLARQTPANTYVKDCSINQSMTRMYVVHGTQNVLLARNVGWKSIGHGYYLEDGTETGNRFHSNIGILARAAVNNVQNDRLVPGILAATPYAGENVPYDSDYDHPTLFWIMNGWNDFIGNMAVGAGTCGYCYWLVPGANSGPSQSMKWTSYASMQNGLGRAGTTPLKTFRGNYCSTAMNSFNVVGNTNCPGFAAPEDGANALVPVPNPLAPAAGDLTYYPTVSGGGGRFATSCSTTDCSTVPLCSTTSEQNCMVTILDHYTSAFHWTETNFGAVWLRPQWYLYINSVLSDVQNGGLTFITGGDYTYSSTIQGHWALAYKNVFIGTTQPNNPYASEAGPFNPGTGLTCGSTSGSHCLAKDEGILMPLSNFALNQRLFSIYDGPAYEDSNAFLDIHVTPISDCSLNPDFGPNNGCSNSEYMYGRVLGMPYDSTNSSCYLPNAAIAWKQPNGFYYPPAFHSRNLFFDNVDIRHFVIEPLFVAGSFATDTTATTTKYCTRNDLMFNGFSDIDRQTELNDDDGSLTGLINTISVNEDPFFSAPIEALECESDGTARTSPYDYVSTVVYPQCVITASCIDWASPCTTPVCYGVPLYRQLRRSDEVLPPAIRMMGEDLSQRNTLTVNHATYYLDTTVSQAQQTASGTPSQPITNLSVFAARQFYNVFFLFAKPTTEQTYQIYVGPGFNVTDDTSLVRVNIATTPFLITPGAWPAGWTRVYDAATGILTVHVNMSGFSTQFDAAHQANCQPQSFCSWDTGTSTCECSAQLAADNPAIYAQCISANPGGGTICGSWAGKDLDCPEGGCFGFSFRLPPGFDNGTEERPPVTCFPKDANWNVPWNPVSEEDEELAGTCFDPPVEEPAFCSALGAPPPRPFRRF